MKRNRSVGRNGIVALAAVTVTAALIAACGASGGAAGDSVDREAAFTIATPVAQSLDPRDAPEPTGLKIATWPVYERLPMLATEWSFSKDGRALTLSLREGVTFSDGTPFDSAAVKANLDWAKKATGTALQANLAGISNVEVVDEHTAGGGVLTTAGVANLDSLAPVNGGVIDFRDIYLTK